MSSFLISSSSQTLIFSGTISKRGTGSLKMLKITSSKL